LVYLLAQNLQYTTISSELLPRLMNMQNADNFPSIFNTAAMVHLNNGQVEQAREFLEKARANVSKEDPEWLSIQLTRAEIKARLDKKSDLIQAKEILADIFGESEELTPLVLRARKLLSQIETRIWKLEEQESAAKIDENKDKTTKIVPEELSGAEISEDPMGKTSATSETL